MEEEGKTAQHITQWEKILDDTPPRLDLDTMAHQADTQSSSLYSTQSLHLDKKIASEMSAFYQRSKVSMFAFALHCLHHTLGAYNHNAFAIGVAHDTRGIHLFNTIGMFVNMVLVPFSNDGRGEESVKDVNRRWVHDVLPYADVPYDVVSQMGYGCNIMLAYNVNFDFVEGKGGDSDGKRSNDSGGSCMIEDGEDSNVEDLS